jgi:hypothetical protein
VEARANQTPFRGSYPGYLRPQDENDVENVDDVSSRDGDSAGASSRDRVQRLR